MAHFYAIIEGSKGPASRMSDKKNGISAIVNSWETGINVEGRHVESNGIDVFHVSATSGSGGGRQHVHFAEITADHVLIHTSAGTYTLEDIGKKLKCLEDITPRLVALEDTLADYDKAAALIARVTKEKAVKP